MADILSLSKARKAKARAEHDQQAAENRVRYGRTKEQKLKDAKERERQIKAAKAHELER